MKLPTAGRKDMTILEAAEVRTLAEAMPSAQYRLSVHVAAYTGVRVGELWALRRRDVNPLRGVLHVRQTVKRYCAAPDAPPDTVDAYAREVGPSKNGRPRSISLSGTCARCSANTSPGPPRRHWPGGPRFVTDAGRPVNHTVFMRQVFRPATAVLPADKRAVRFHDLRHTCASLLIFAGAHAKLVQERLGHASITTTLNVYGHILPAAESALVDALDAIHAGSG